MGTLQLPKLKKLLDLFNREFLLWIDSERNSKIYFRSCRCDLHITQASLTGRTTKSSSPTEIAPAIHGLLSANFIEMAIPSAIATANIIIVTTAIPTLTRISLNHLGTGRN